jgi:hypothetical protein
MWQSRVPATMMQKTLTSRKTGRLGVSVRHDQETVPQRSIDAGGAGSCSVKWVGGTPRDGCQNGRQSQGLDGICMTAELDFEEAHHHGR